MSFIPTNIPRAAYSSMYAEGAIQTGFLDLAFLAVHSGDVGGITATVGMNLCTRPDTKEFRLCCLLFITVELLCLCYGTIIWVGMTVTTLIAHGRSSHFLVFLNDDEDLFFTSLLLYFNNM